MALLSMPMFRIQGVTRTTSSAPETQGDDTDIAITTVLSKEGRFEETQHVFNIMYPPQNSSVAAAAAAYHSLLQSCLNNAKSSLPEAKLVHAHMIQMHFQCQDISLTNKLVTVYAKFGCLADARRVFDQMPDRDVVSWTAMISAYARDRYADKALKMFDEMKQTGVQPNHFTFSSVLPACATLASLEQGREIHEEISTSGFLSEVFVGNALVDMYAKCGSIEEARHVFDKMPQRDVVSWNAMISGYALNGQIDKALELFQNIPKRNVVSWTSMITGYAQNGLAVEALKLFQQMQRAGVKPISNTFASVLSACADLAALDQGMEVHEDIIRSQFNFHASVGNSLVDMYSKCGQIKYAHTVFEKMSERNVVSWTAMIGGYVQNGLCEQALTLFRQMQRLSIRANLRTFVGLLPACADLAALEQGMEIHGDIIRSGFQFDVFVGNALVDMYAKCGTIDSARNLFDKMSLRDVVSWTVIIAGYALHGQAHEALKLFEKMQQSGTNPNHVTFVAVLCACCHAGLVNEGQRYFDDMTKHYHIAPVMEHYGCIVDLLGRAGCLTEAEDFINQMPIKPDVTVWGCLLGACSFHNNIEVGERVAERFFELDPNNSAPYVVLSNLYATAGRWGDIEKIRRLMKGKKVKKKPGCSWIEINKRVHSFLIGDKPHKETENS